MAIIVTAIVVGGGTVYAYTYLASDIAFTPSEENKENGWDPGNVENAINDLYKNTQDISELKSYIEQLENKVQLNNWTLVVSYNVYLGWNGNYGYGSVPGKITIKSVNGEINITESGGVNSSPSDRWNGTYYINSKASDFKIVSFTVD